MLFSRSCILHSIILFIPLSNNHSKLLPMLEKNLKLYDFQEINQIYYLWAYKTVKRHLPKQKIFENKILCIISYVCGCVCLVVSDSLKPIDVSPPGSSVHGIFQARILEWVCHSFSRGSSWPRHHTGISCICRQILYH